MFDRNKFIKASTNKRKIKPVSQILQGHSLCKTRKRFSRQSREWTKALRERNKTMRKWEKEKVDVVSYWQTMTRPEIDRRKPAKEEGNEGEEWRRCQSYQSLWNWVWSSWLVVSPRHSIVRSMPEEREWFSKKKKKEKKSSRADQQSIPTSLQQKPTVTMLLGRRAESLLL